MSIYDERPKRGQLVVWDDELWVVTGYRFDPAFIDIVCINDSHRTYTYPYYRMNVLEITKDDVPHIKNLTEFKLQYPEYFI